MIVSARKTIDTAGKKLDNLTGKTKTITSKLKDVDTLPAEEAKALSAKMLPEIGEVPKKGSEGSVFTNG